MVIAAKAVMIHAVEMGEDYPYEDDDLVRAMLSAAMEHFVYTRPKAQDFRLPQLRRSTADVGESKEFVYFVSDGSAIKIGKAKDPKSRVTGMNTGASSKLEILGVVPGGYEKERKLHETFSRHRLRGEWFSPAPELLDYISANARRLH